MSCRNTATRGPIRKGGVYFRNEKQWMVKQVDYENVGRKRMQCVLSSPRQTRSRRRLRAWQESLAVVTVQEMRIRLKESCREKVAFDKENKELISNISHDLKTPITAIKGVCGRHHGRCGRHAGKDGQIHPDHL